MHSLERVYLVKLSNFLYLEPVTGDVDIESFPVSSIFWVIGHDLYKDGLYMIDPRKGLRAIKTEKPGKKK